MRASWGRAIPPLLIAGVAVLAAGGVDVSHVFDRPRIVEIRAVERPTPPPAAAPAAPLPTTAPPAENPTAEQIAQYLRGRHGTAVVAVFDAKRNTTWSSSAERLTSASAIKVAILEATLLNAQQQHRGLTAGELSTARQMIATSDNTAATTLWQRLGPVDNIQRLFNQLGLTETVAVPSWGLTTTTAADQVKAVRLFAYPNDVLSDASRTTMHELLRAVVPGQRWGVTHGPPNGVLVKNGWLPTATGWSINSIGFVRSGGKEYAIAVLTARGPSQAYGMETIAGVSRIVWSHAGT